MTTHLTDPYATPGWTAPASQDPQTQQTPQEPWWQRDGVVSRILVLAGVGVTLIGVVMMLVVAAQHGLLGPQVRVVGGALLSAGLIGAGWRVMTRPGGRIGGVALQATGFAGMYLDVLAITTFYAWVPSLVGLGLALGVTVAGALAAMRWDAQSLAILAIACGAALAPFLTQELNTTLVAFLLIFAAVGAVPEILRGWSALAPVRTAPVVLVAVTAYGIAPMLTGDPTPLVGLLACVTVVVVGVGSGLLAMRTRVPVAALVTMVCTPVPGLVAGAQLEPVPAAAWYALLAVLLLAPVAVLRDLHRPVAVALSSLSGLSMLFMAAVLADHLQTALPFLGLAVVLLAVDLTRPTLAMRMLGHATLLVGALLFMVEVPLTTVMDSTAAQTISTGTTVTAWAGVLAAALAGLSVARSRSLMDGWRPFVLMSDVALGLYAVTAGFVAAGVQALGGQAGFSLGQFLATAASMATAAGLLAFGLRRPDHARIALSSGLGLIAVAMTKLFVFDLAALNGLGRAAAFLVVGLTLLAVGTRYARAFAERTPPGSPAPAA